MFIIIRFPTVFSLKIKFIWENYQFKFLISFCRPVTKETFFISCEYDVVCLTLGTNISSHGHKQWACIQSERRHLGVNEFTFFRPLIGRLLSKSTFFGWWSQLVHPYRYHSTLKQPFLDFTYWGWRSNQIIDSNSGRFHLRIESRRFFVVMQLFSVVQMSE